MMNNSKILKLLILTLFCVFLFAMMFVTFAEAETEKPEIIGKNILYTDKTAIQFAVDPATVDKNDVRLVVTKSDGTEITIKSFEESETLINGVSGALVFTIEGVPASAVCDTVTAVVKSGNRESLPLTYSVAEYFYERLYSDGIINATADDALASRQKALYENYLGYAESAQELFKNYYGEESVTLVSEYRYIGGFGAVFANGNDSMLSAESFTTTVSANASLAADKSFAGKWTVTTYGETVTTKTVADGETVKVSGKMSVTPVRVYSDARGDYFLSDAAGTRWDYDTITTIHSDNIGSKGGTGSITIADGSLYLDDGDAENVPMYVKFYDGTVADCTIFEFDFKLTQSYGTYPIQIKVADVTYTIYYSEEYDASYGTGNKLCIDANGVHLPLGIGINEWGTLRFEHYYDKKVVKVFANNEFLVDITTEPGLTKQSNIIYLTGNERGETSDADLYLDNIYAGNINKEFVSGDPDAAK